MTAWERGSPMRSFIYYLQRATCGALTYLVVHQLTLGLRLIGATGTLRNFAETTLSWLSTPGRYFIATFCDPIRPLNLPPPLAVFASNIAFYFIVVWLVCFAANYWRGGSFTGKRRDPFQLMPTPRN